MKSKKLLKVTGLALAAMVATSTIAPLTAYAATGVEVDVSTANTLKADTENSSDFQNWLSTVWSSTSEEKANANSDLITLTPGNTETCLNFAWYGQKGGTPAVRVWKGTTGSAVATDAKVVTGKQTEISAENWQGETYTASNKVDVNDYFEENTSYVYQYTDSYNGDSTVWSEQYSYTTGSFSSFTTILTGDPQIGASGSSNDKSADDSSIARDTYNWNKTMANAISKVSNAAFLLSAGDQVDHASVATTDNTKIRESEYAGYLYPSVFRSLPIASSIGNHDTVGSDYTAHFNNPNASTKGATAAGGDYYFSYDNVLFISLNSNSRNQEEHRALMQEAVDSNPDATWKVVIFHSDIYGSGQPHSDSDATANRIILAPLMDEFDIDVCFTGHDHTYSRSYQILNGSVVDYDISDGTVTDPEGTLYITTGSASGSKFYNLLNYTPYYIADRTNACYPSYSTVEFTSSTLSIATYDYNGNEYAESFTIKKDADDVTVDELEDQVSAIDQTKYTADSYKAVTDAMTNLQSLYTPLEDKAAALVASTYDNATGTDALYSGYGQVKDSSNKDSVVYAESNTNTGRLKRGVSSLLDRTIYTQLTADGTTTGDTSSAIVSGTTYKEAKQAVIDAISNLKAIETSDSTTNETDKTATVDTEDQVQGIKTISTNQSTANGNKAATDTTNKAKAVTSDSVKTGDTTMVYPFGLAVICGCALGGYVFKKKREGRCEKESM